MKRLSYPRCTSVVAACGAIRSSSSYIIIILPGIFLCRISVKDSNVNPLERNPNLSGLKVLRDKVEARGKCRNIFH